MRSNCTTYIKSELLKKFNIIKKIPNNNKLPFGKVLSIIPPNKEDLIAFTCFKLF